MINYGDLTRGLCVIIIQLKATYFQFTVGYQCLAHSYFTQTTGENRTLADARQTQSVEGGQTVLLEGLGLIGNPILN